MVHAFVIHTLCPGNSGSGSVCRVLYSKVFSIETLEATSENREVTRLKQKEQIAAVARQVTSACSLSRQAAGKSILDLSQTTLDESSALLDADYGVFRLFAGEPFQQEKVVLWLGVISIGFTMVCEPHDNLLLAENVLRTLASHCLEHLRLLGPGTDILLKADRTEAILNRFLPHGQLLFTNHRFMQALEKDLGAYMAK
ncbi:AP-5 complex subunit sigma-1 [Erpetoichthys calabaricus]|uniref:Adaptor related protein complex 5 subunit sigma 1 n=1 Tax=Erpetoichthys calabaricus TaxID=27687 RepID=A0A8C4RRL7_ERPCA|nr:AP-5 complex subunit sigma-1 [Erpetoichthys calabaricus]